MRIGYLGALLATFDPSKEPPQLPGVASGMKHPQLDEADLRLQL